MRLDEILAVLRGIAPEETALKDDPVGLLIGSTEEQDITALGVCLDATPEATARAVAAGAQLIVAHHPLIYHPLKRLIPAADPISRAVGILLKSSIALYAMHTNWDRAPSGINDTLAELLELRDIRPLGAEGSLALPRIGDLASPRPLADFAHSLQTILNCTGTNTLRINAISPNTIITRVAVCGGAGAFLLADARAAGAEAYVTSDVRHHEFLEAAGQGLAIFDAGHEATETPGMQTLVRILQERLIGVKIFWVGPD